MSSILSLEVKSFCCIRIRSVAVKSLQGLDYELDNQRSFIHFPEMLEFFLFTSLVRFWRPFHLLFNSICSFKTCQRQHKTEKPHIDVSVITICLAKLTLLWHHEICYVNSTMGSYWPHLKKGITAQFITIFFSPNILEHRFVLKYRQIDTTLLRNCRIYRSK
jgi:hypothetical protein